MIITLFVIYVIIILGTIFSVLLYGNSPIRSLSWVLIIITIPILGVLFYVVLGINRRKFKFFQLNFSTKRSLYDFKHKREKNDNFSNNVDSEKIKKLEVLMSKSSGFPAVEGNRINLLKNGKDTFEEIFKTLEIAEKFIHIQYYLIEEGVLLNKLINLFALKINEGVEVRLLYDALGSNNLKKRTIEKLKKIGVDVFSILPLNMKSLLTTINYRNHRKIIIIDGITCFTGGVNISDKYIEDSPDLGVWEDIHLKVKGPLVDHLHRVFIKDFYFASNKELLNENKYSPKQNKVGESLAQVVVGGPDLKYVSILYQYTAMIDCAEKSICIENPYFIPNKMLLEALKMAVLRGVDVQLIIPKKTDNIIAKYSMYANFEDLLSAGVTIGVLQEGFLHSKLIIVDDEIASVGSGNFDYRSFEHNYEMNTLIYDNEIAKELSNNFKKNRVNCLILDYDSFKKRSLKQKLLEGFARIFSPLL